MASRSRMSSRDHRLALRHPERPQDPLAQELRQLAAVQRPGEDPEHVVHRVVVVKVLAGRIRGEVPQLRVGLKDVAGARQAGGMRQQVMRGDRRECRLDAQPRQVVDDRPVEIELALVAQLQERERHERLRDRADLEQLVTPSTRSPRLEVAESVGHDALHGLAVREHQRHAGRIHVAHVLLDEPVERRDRWPHSDLRRRTSPLRSRGMRPCR